MDKKVASATADEVLRLGKALHNPNNRQEGRHNTMVDNFQSSTKNDTTKACPFCAEQILVNAKKCKHCGEFLDGSAKPGGTTGQREQAAETTENEAHPSMFRSRPLEFIIVLALCLVGVGLIVLSIWWIRTLGTTLTVTSRRTTLRKGLLSKFTSEVFHKDVRNVQVTQTAMQRLFNVGKIEISSAGQGDFEIAVEGMRDPNKVKQIIDRSRSA